jgi:RNA polymerase sigma-70 factor (ECF subfamily)
VDALPIDFRMVVILADLQEFSYKEIAEILDVPVGTVMSRLYRGRRLLQKALAAYAVKSGVLPDRGEDVDGSIDLEAWRKRKGRSA